MTGGDIHAADRFLVADTECDDRCGCVAIGEQRFQPGLFKNLGRGQSKLASQKTGVVADDDQRAFAVNG